MTTLHVFHTNDFHNHLSLAQAEVILKQRQAFDSALLLDAGDAVSAGNVGVRPGGEPILEQMSSLGYDAMTMGNREFHVAETLLRMKIKSASFPILCANIQWREDCGQPLPVVPSMLRTLPSGLRVAVFGVSVPMVTSHMAARVISAFHFEDPVIAARRQLAALRSQADIIIALTHIGLREDERLARACPDLDLIVGGHSHAVLAEPSVIAGVAIVQGGWFGHYLGHVTLDVTDGDVSVTSGRLLSLKES